MRSKNGLLYLSLFLVVGACGYLMYLFSTGKHSEAATQSVGMTLNVLEYIDFQVTDGSSVTFGDMTPGFPISAPSSGTICSVTSNASNGYTLAVQDNVAGTDSALVHAIDGTTHVADYAGTTTTPTSWAGTGLGVGLFAADTSKEAKWGTGTTYNDSNNKYAGIPQNAAIIHTVTGYHSGADTSSWAFKVDVPNNQKTGSYSGSVTFTALPVTS